MRPEVPTGEGLYHRKWDTVRINKTIIKLLHSGKLKVEGLISHRFPLGRAREAYELIEEHPEQVTKVVFDVE